MTLFIFSTRKEARATLELLKAKPLPSHIDRDSLPTHYQCDLGWIVICGIGPWRALSTLLQVNYPYTEIINIGIAGSLKPTLERGPYPIQSVHNYFPHRDEKNELFAPPFSLQPEGKKLITSSSPLHQDSVRERLQAYDLVDMEGYSLAHGAQELGKKIQMWKIVSDLVSNQGREQIKQRIDSLSEHIAYFIEKEL